VKDLKILRPAAGGAQNDKLNGIRTMLKKSKKIGIGDKVLVVINNEAKELEIVDLPQGDPAKGIISWLSPIAQAILGKGYPEKVTVKLPNGKTLDCQLVRLAH